MPFLSVEQTTSGEGMHLCAPSFFAQKRQESPGLRRDGEISLSVRPFDPVIAALPNDREVAAAQ